ncbi:putative glycosyltransferase [Histomonas meleagridis]|uniref:putative glycosyltransferase n=1 Tax=Histomonas meleagridis TaxID=135588 RepID=UPI00355A79A9|nr:putative glycosyltransferase [Histomonas meleagridis]KAH0803135.1 putative glycosyltransferase [Histomonas meleagridis]
MLSPILTNNPDEADFFYIPVYTYSCQKNEDGCNISQLIEEVRSIGPWYDRKNGSDHIIATSFETLYFNSVLHHSVFNDNFIIVSPNPQSGNSSLAWHGQRNIAVPFVSYFPNYPPEKIDWTRKRKYTAFIAQTYNVTNTQSKNIRQKATSLIRNMTRGKVLLFRRYKSSVIKTVKSLPEYYLDSDFCICPRGDLIVPSKRVFDVVHFGCIPVFISDPMMPPFEGVYLNYSKFSVRIPEKEIEKMPEILESYTQEQIQEMRNELKHAAKTFRFGYPGNKPPIVGEAFWAFSWMLYIRHLYQEQYHDAYFPPVISKIVNNSIVN